MLTVLLRLEWAHLIASYRVHSSLKWAFVNCSKKKKKKNKVKYNAHTKKKRKIRYCLYLWLAIKR